MRCCRPWAGRPASTWRWRSTTPACCERYGVRVLGTPLAAVRAAEDRGGFRDLVTGIGEPVPESAVVETLEDGMRFVEALTRRSSSGPPSRSAAAAAASRMNPDGGADADRAPAWRRAPSARSWSSASCSAGTRSSSRSCATRPTPTIAICGMENLDPMGVHTGDSIVVAPIQTLPDPVVQRLRRCALKIVRALKLEGGCNVQLAVAPDGSDYRVIEVNPRVSRSSRAGVEGDRLPDRARSPRSSRSASGCTSCRIPATGGNAPPSSRRSTTSSSSCRAGRSTSSRSPTAASASR